MAKFSERFKELLDTAGMEYTDIQSQLGISRYQLYNWSSGRGEPDSEGFKLIAKTFKVNLAWLLGESDNKRDPVPTAEADDLPPEAQIMLNNYRDFLLQQFKK